MARMLRWLGLATLTFSFTGALFGCVPQEKYEAVVREREAALEAASSAQEQAASAQSQAAAYKAELDKYGDTDATIGALRTNDQQQIASLNAELAALQARYDDLANKMPSVTITGGGALPPELSNALSDFARDNPGVVDFDAARGVVKFKSDLTFATGSAELTPEAKSALSKFCTILNSPAAAGYDLMVAGHTDNVPVSNPVTIRNGHKDNWYLSCHRAISVAEAMIHEGVNAGRLGTAGYGDERPIAENSTDAGRRQNRRVEVLILPTKFTHPSVAEGPARHPKVAPKAEWNKDTSVVAPTTPEFNK